jgi:hypothetical protein
VGEELPAALVEEAVDEGELLVDGDVGVDSRSEVHHHVFHLRDEEHLFHLHTASLDENLLVDDFLGKDRGKLIEV